MFIFSLFGLSFCHCSQDRISVPKPHSFPRIEFPEHMYRTFSEEYCPMVFDASFHSVINKKKHFFNSNPEHECWFNILYAAFNATIYFTTHTIDQENILEELIDDAYLMASKHNDRATSRKEFLIENQNGLSGVLFEIGGPVASPIQFYVTDTKNNFVRGSLYYNNESVNDSISIVTDYIMKDIDKIIGSIRFQ